MNERIKDELLSAYFDGEATPTERETVELWLAASPEAQQELAEYRQLSQLLRGLPHESLPPDFAAQVMFQAERRTLFPSQPAAAASKLASGQPASRFPRWLKFAAPLVATAALVVVVVKLLPNNRGPNRAGRQLAENSRPVARDERAPEAAALRTSPLGGGGAKVESAQADSNGVLGERLLDGSGRAGNGFVLGKNEGHANNGIQAADGAQSTLVVSDESKRFAAPSSGSTEVVVLKRADALAEESVTFLNRDGRQPEFKVGEVVEALEKSGDNVVVVKLWVVDTRRDLNKLRALLARNDIPEVPQQNLAAGEQPGLRDPQSGNLIAVLVEATTEQISSAFAELAKETQVALEDPKLSIPAAELSVVAVADTEFPKTAAEGKPEAPAAAKPSAAAAPPAPAVPSPQKGSLDAKDHALAKSGEPARGPAQQLETLDKHASQRSLNRARANTAQELFSQQRQAANSRQTIVNIERDSFKQGPRDAGTQSLFSDAPRAAANAPEPRQNRAAFSAQQAGQRAAPAASPAKERTAAAPGAPAETAAPEPSRHVLFVVQEAATSVAAPAAPVPDGK